MDNITGNYYSTIQYNNTDIKTNSLNIAAGDGFGTDNVKFTLDVSTSGMDSDGNKILGRGESLTYTISISNFNDSDLTGYKGPITNWNFCTAIPIVLTLPKGISLKDYTNESVPEGSESPYIIYTENGVSTNMKRVVGSSSYEDGMYAYRILEKADYNECTFLIPDISANTTAYITFIGEATSTASLGDTLTASATINFTENDTGSPLTSGDVSVKYSYVALSAEKKAPAYVSYGEEFTYQIVMKNDGNIPANIDKISDLLPEKFIISKDENSAEKISIKRDTTPLTKDTDFILSVKTGSIDITPATANKLDIPGSSTLTVDIIGKIEKSD